MIYALRTERHEIYCMIYPSDILHHPYIFMIEYVNIMFNIK